MPIDLELSRVLEHRLATQGGAVDIAGMRAAYAATGAALPRPLGAVVEDDVVRHRGVDIPIRLYRPAAEARPPLLVFLHGGGWMFGDLDSHDAACRHLVEAGACAVAAVAYRLAPEHPFPAGLDDCHAAATWLLDNSHALGFDPSRVAIGGESAGGNLAAVLAHKLAKRHGVRPMLQLLVHPLVDFRFVAPSITSVAVPGLHPDSLALMRGAYLQGDANLLDPDVSPALAPDLAGLPTAIVVTVEIDPLRDEGEAYALQLAAAGVETMLVRIPGLVHGFMFESAEIRIVGETFIRIGQWLRRAFASTATARTST